jgi:hypothetical protein
MTTKYLALDDEQVSCPVCGLTATLLATHAVRGPAFYLAPCGFIGEVGVGMVRGCQLDVVRRAVGAEGLIGASPKA